MEKLWSNSDREQQVYSPLSDISLNESDAEQAASRAQSSLSKTLNRWRSFSLLMVVICFLQLIVSILSARSCGGMSDHLWCTHLANSNLRGPWLIHSAAPLNEAIAYEDLDLVNPFDHQTVYRGPPTPAIEQAWDNLWLRMSSHPLPPEMALTRA